MSRSLSSAVTAAALLAAVVSAQPLPRDVIPTSAGGLGITFVGHGSLIFDVHGTVIHVDPYGRLADYSTLPDADLVLITHGHGDHLDPAALSAVRAATTTVVAPPSCADRVPGAVVMANGDERVIGGIPIAAVPAYNVVHTRPDGRPYHPRGEGNGYVLTFGDTRVYVAGDTENIPEMAALKNVAVAFLPMNLPYTMTPEMVADAARSFRPRILYPYHYGETDPARLVALLADEPGIEVRVRPLR